MKTKLSGLAVMLMTLIAAGCSTVDSRIARNRAAFNTWPPAVQDKVVAGKVDVGFTTDQVRVALGEPDRVWSRTTADGTSQVWSYRDRRPRFGFGVGVGVGSYGRNSATFGGLSVASGTGYRDDERMGVVFDRNGLVSSIETRGR